MEKILRNFIKSVIAEEIGRDFKSVKFMDQVDILKDPRLKVEFMTINRDDHVDHQVKIEVPQDESLSTDSITFTTNDEATHWARNVAKNILVKLDQKNP